jgi:hypothetical protein
MAMAKKYFAAGLPESAFEKLEIETDRSLKVVEMPKFYAHKATGQ